jgi:hypothetical protein
MNKIAQTTAVLCLLVSLASCENTIVFKEVPALDELVTRVIRESPVLNSYTLVQSRSSIFADLHDKFYLPKAQRVRIFYTITTRTDFSDTWIALQTHVYINGVIQHPFTVVSYVKY